MQKLTSPDFTLARYVRLLFALALLSAAPSAHAKCLRLGTVYQGGISTESSELLNSCAVRVGYQYCILNATAGSPFSCADQKFGAGFVGARGKDGISIYGADGPPRVLWIECEAQGPDDYPVPSNPHFNMISVDGTCPAKKDKDNPPKSGDSDAGTSNPFTVTNPSPNGGNSRSTAGSQSAGGRSDNPFLAGNQKTNSNNPFTNNGKSGRSSQAGPNSSGAGDSSSGNTTNCPGLTLPLTISMTSLTGTLGPVDRVAFIKVSVSSCNLGVGSVPAGLSFPDAVPFEAETTIEWNDGTEDVHFSHDAVQTYALASPGGCYHFYGVNNTPRQDDAYVAVEFFYPDGCQPGYPPHWYRHTAGQRDVATGDLHFQ